MRGSDEGLGRLSPTRLTPQGGRRIPRGADPPSPPSRGWSRAEIVQDRPFSDPGGLPSPSGLCFSACTHSVALLRWALFPAPHFPPATLCATRSHAHSHTRTHIHARTYTHTHTHTYTPPHARTHARACTPTCTQNPTMTLLLLDDDALWAPTMSFGRCVDVLLTLF